MFRQTALTVLLAATVFGGIPPRAAAQAAPATIVVVRHAERADAGPAAGTMMASDPDLSEAGRARAEALASMLRDVPVSAVYATEFKRTQQTAAPAAALHEVKVTTVSSKDTEGLVAKLKQTTGIALVVGHSNTVPEILKALGATAPVTIRDDEFDNVFIVRPGSPASVIRLHMPPLPRR